MALSSIIVCTLVLTESVVGSCRFKNFAGQTWVRHLVDESKRGLYKGESPRPPYIGWSPQDISGSRWLQCLDVSVASGVSRGASAEELLRQPPAAWDKDNLFARIIRGEIPSHKVLETEHGFAILDAYPTAKYHTLLLAKEPSVDISDLDQNSAAAFLGEVSA